MKTPEFWYMPPDEKGLMAKILKPIGTLYMGITKRRVKKKPRYVSRYPTICVGNITAGGAGKTPVVLSLIEVLKGMGFEPYILTRGYGGSQKEALLVDEKTHDAGLVGDEPLLLASYAPVIVAKDRMEGATYIDETVKLDNAVIIMDDGFQSPDIKKDISFIVADGGVGFGNEMGIPAGPLREDIDLGIKRAAALIVIGADKTGLKTRYQNYLPFLVAEMILDPSIINLLNGKRYIAFAGIGRPKKFFDSLKNQCKAEVVAEYSFADHHYFRDSEIEELKNKAAKENAMLVTTEKDYMRLSLPMRKSILSAEASLKWENETALEEILKPLIEK